MEASWHFVGASAFVVVGIHIDRAGPVFGGGRLNEKLTTPGIDLDFIYGAVKKLDPDSAVAFVDRDNLEQCPSGRRNHLPIVGKAIAIYETP